jgi:hypothetical protein
MRDWVRRAAIQAIFEKKLRVCGERSVCECDWFCFSVWVWEVRANVMGFVANVGGGRLRARGGRDQLGTPG